MTNPQILFSECVAELPRGTNNPRNSEGDFERLKDGSILFAYSKYSGNDANDNAPCDIAGMISDDNGKTFRHLPHLLATAEEHNTLNIMSVSLLRISNGDLCLFYLCKKGANSEVYLRRAKDDETHFAEAELCIPRKKGIYYVVNNCRICKLENGELLIPIARHKIINGGGSYFGTAQIFASDKNALNWGQRSNILKLPNPGHSNTGLQEPGLITLPDGRLLCYFRTDRHFQFESFSEDNGKTWSIPVPSRFTSPDSPMLIMRNPYSGIYYSFWNPIPNYNGRLDSNKKWVNAGRTPFVFAVSENGIDYSEYTEIESDPTHGYCYPAVHFLAEKSFLLSYCCGGEEDGMCLTKTRIRLITLK